MQGRTDTFRDGTDGQAYTLEAFVAGLLILSALVFALQVTAVTPLSASTSSQHIENQQKSAAEGALTAVADVDALKPGISTIDGNGTFYGEGSGGAYVNEFPPGEFGNVFDRTFGDRGLAITVDIRYQDDEESWDRVRMVDSGSPSDHAVTVTRTVVLYDDDSLYEPDGNGGIEPHEQHTWGDQDPLDVGDDVNQGSDVYNVVVVEVTVWRM